MREGVILEFVQINLIEKIRRLTINKLKELQVLFPYLNLWPIPARLGAQLMPLRITSSQTNLSKYLVNYIV